MTQQEFSKEFGIGKTTLSNIINGKTRLNRGHAAILAQGFKNDIKYWIDKYIDYESRVTASDRQDKKVEADFASAVAPPKGMHGVMVAGKIFYFHNDEDPQVVARRIRGYEIALAQPGKG